MVHVGKKIQDLLSVKGLTQTDLAKKMGLSPQTISQALTKPSMTTDTLQKILNVTGIKSWEIFEPGESYLSTAQEPIPVYSQNTISDDSGHYKYMLIEKDKLIAEKERLIQILLKNQSKP